MGWIGALLQLVGRWRVASFHRDAFLWAIAGKVIWVAWYFDSAVPVVVLNAIAIGFDYRAWKMWRGRGTTDLRVVGSDHCRTVGRTVG